MTVPANSPSFFAYDNVDSDEETWEQGKAFRMGSSRDGRRDSLTSHMSEMSRGAHETDSNAYFVSDPPRSVKGTESRSSMLQKYSRAVGSAHARKDASFSSKHGLYLISGYDFFLSLFLFVVLLYSSLRSSFYRPFFHLNKSEIYLPVLLSQIS